MCQRLAGKKTYLAHVRHFEGPAPGHLVVEIHVRVIIWDQVAVEVVVQVRLRDLVSQGNCIWDEFAYRVGHCPTQAQNWLGAPIPAQAHLPRLK